MATIKIPPVLRPSTSGEKEVSAEGADVGTVLHALAEGHPQTESQLFGADGDLNRYVNVYLNDEDVRVLQGLDTACGRPTRSSSFPRWPAGGRLVADAGRSGTEGAPRPSGRTAWTRRRPANSGNEESVPPTARSSCTRRGTAAGYS